MRYTSVSVTINNAFDWIGASYKFEKTDSNYYLWLRISRVYLVVFRSRLDIDNAMNILFLRNVDKQNKKIL